MRGRRVSVWELAQSVRPGSGGMEAEPGHVAARGESIQEDCRERSPGVEYQRPR